MKEVTQYVAIDGRVFTDKNDCLTYEQTLHAERCTECKGRGGEHVDDGHGCWGEPETAFITCRYCKGSGTKDKNWNLRFQTIEKINALEDKLRTL